MFPKLNQSSPPDQMRTPALDAWRRELRNGERTRHTFDPLWRAACLEANARDSYPELRDHWFIAAERVLWDAVKQEAA